MNKANEGLTGLLGAYGSDNEDESGSGSHEDGGENGAALLGKDGAAAMAPESEADEEDEGLAKLLTPGRMHDSASTARFTITDTAPGASPSQGADPGRSAGPSTSESQQQRCTLLPPELADEPPGPVDPAIQATVQRLIEVRQTSNRNITNELRQVRDYKNPDFLQKMVKHFGVRDKGSCFPKDVFDPEALPKEDFYTALASAHEAEQKRKQDERSKVGPQFVKGTSEQMKLPPYAKGTSGSTSAAHIAAQAKAQALVANASKKMKWDSK